MYSELSRMIANLIKQGVVAEVDAVQGLVRVRHGELLTDWLGYFVPAAGGVSVHRPPSVGENCIVLSPSGEPANGIVLCGIKSALHPQPAGSANETVIQFPDGAKALYNHTAGALKLSGVKTVDVQAETSLTIDCPQNTVKGMLTVQGLFTYQSGMSGSNGAGGKTEIEGDFTHKGTLTNEGSISSNGVILDTHIHPGDSGGITGEPKK